MSRLTRDGTAEPVSRDQILRSERGEGNIIFPCSADHDQEDWQPYPLDPYSCYILCVTIRTTALTFFFYEDYIFWILLVPKSAHETRGTGRLFFFSRHSEMLYKSLNSYLGACVCVVIPFILDVRFVDVPAGVTQEEDHTEFLYLPSAVLSVS